LNRLDLKDFLAALNVGFHKENYFIESCQAQSVPRVTVPTLGSE
jgi:hypothetical protein